MQLLQQALPPEQQMLQRQEREAEEGKIQTRILYARRKSEAHVHCLPGLNNKITNLLDM